MPSDIGAVRRTLRVAALVILCASLAWTIWLFVLGGFDRTILGVRVRSNNPERVLIASAVALAVYGLAGGRVRVAPAASFLHGLFSALSRRPGWIAGALALTSTMVASANHTRIAGGADAYGYVSQAELWLAGDLKVRQPWVEHVPWPNAPWTFTPLGYRPMEGEWSIVPTYSPGLPMLMAAAKRVGGQCALFAVVPLTLGLAVLATYGLGRRLGSPWAGVIAAWLVATSPVVLEVSFESLTDVPAMAAWSLAFFFLLGRTIPSALAAGLCAAAAILIRPNLVPLALPMGAWFFLRGWPGPEVRESSAARRVVPHRLVEAAVFALGVAPGIVAVAAINRHLYGSASSSGYGRLADGFAAAHVVPNLARFFSWIVETQTPLALLGIAALVAPVRRIWPAVADRRVFVVIGLYVAVLWAQYSAYLEFDSAGYLRFLLPGWPFMMLGLASVVLAMGRLNGPGVRAFAAAAVVALGVWNVHVATARGVFEQRQAARHEAPIGRLVRAHTEENSVILSVHRSGSLRYYAGRTTLRYDMLDRHWLDRAITWFREQGANVYAVVDERERREARDRFADQQAVAAFDRAVLVYEPAGTALYDLTRPPASTKPPIVIEEAQPDLPGCDPPAAVLRSRTVDHNAQVVRSAAVAARFDVQKREPPGRPPDLEPPHVAGHDGRGVERDPSASNLDLRGRRSWVR
jgi:hypothetical protein